MLIKYFTRVLYLLSILSVLLYTVGCTGSTNDGVGIATLDGTFTIVDTYSLDLPTDVAVNSWVQKVHLGTEPELYYLDKVSQKIYIFNLTEKVVVDTITFSRSGPNGVGEVYGFSVKSPDSIALASGPYAYSYVVDREGSVIDRINYVWPEEQLPDYVRLNSRYYKDFAFDENKYFLVQRTPYKGARPAEVLHHPIVAYDPVAESGKLLPFSYPEDYWKSNKANFQTFNHDADYLYYGLIGSHKLYRIDKKTYDVETVTAKSRFIDDIETMNDVLDASDAILHGVSNGKYTATFPDPFRKVIYRIVVLPPEDRMDIKSRIRELRDAPDRLSIIVLDDKLNLLFEEELPARTYFPHGIFVDKRGINIPKTHPTYLIEANNETTIQYDVFLPSY